MVCDVSFAHLRTFHWEARDRGRRPGDTTNPTTNLGELKQSLSSQVNFCCEFFPTPDAPCHMAGRCGQRPDRSIPFGRMANPAQRCSGVATRVLQQRIPTMRKEMLARSEPKTTAHSSISFSRAVRRIVGTMEVQTLGPGLKRGRHSPAYEQALS